MNLSLAWLINEILHQLPRSAAQWSLSLAAASFLQALQDGKVWASTEIPACLVDLLGDSRQLQIDLCRCLKALWLCILSSSSLATSSPVLATVLQEGKKKAFIRYQLSCC